MSTNETQSAAEEGAQDATAEIAERGRKRDDRPKRREIPIEEKLELGTTAATEALQLLGIEVESLAGRVDGDQIIIALGAITKPEGAALEGRVYESLQFILNKSVNKHSVRRTRLRIEAAGFTGRRADRLDKAAHALARKVVSLRRPLTIGPLGDDDLKQFTAQLHRAGGVAVHAVGEDPSQRLVVSPGGRKRRRR